MRIPQEGHDVAQVCLNGHKINQYSRTSPTYNAKFCAKCGASVIDRCVCGGEIRGGIVGRLVGGFEVPSFCQHCGKPFPWTEQALAAAREYSNELTSLTEEEKTSLNASLVELTSDTPRTPLAASRVQRLMDKIGKPAANMFMQIAVTIMTEEAKKHLGLK